MGYSKRSKIHLIQKTTDYSKPPKTNYPIKKMYVVTNKGCARTSKLRIVCSKTRPSTLPISATGRKQDVKISKLKKIPAEPGDITRLSLVAKSSIRNLTHTSRSIHNFYNDGCLRLGLGSDYKRRQTDRHMEQRTTKMALQQEGNVGGVSDGHPKQRVAKRQFVPCTIGQQDSSVLHPKRRRNEVPYTPQADKKAFNSDQRVRYLFTSPLYSGEIQRDSGQSLSEPRLTRMVPVEAGGQNNLPEMGNPTGGSVCVEKIGSGTSLRNRRSLRQKSTLCRRILEAVELGSSVAFPTPVPHASSTASPKRSFGTIYSGMSEMGASFLETGSQIESDCPSICSPKPTYQPNRPENRHCPTADEEFSIGNMEGTGWDQITKNWPTKAKKLLSKSWRPSTLKTYRAAWLRWTSWARRNGCKVNDPSHEQLARYLCELYNEEQLSAATILVHKSVVCNFANPQRASFLSSHPIVIQVTKAISNDKPTKNNTVWKLDFLIDWLENVHVKENSLYEVSRHAALLLLVHTGRRLHDLTLLTISQEGLHFDDEDDALTFWPQFGSKTDSSTYRQLGWHFKRNHKQNLDPIYWIRKLVELSNVRRAARDGLDNLFITTVGKVRAASRTVIAGWIRGGFKAASLNASPGSIRAAVASDNFARGLDIDTVLRKGNWRCKETFMNHYFKDISPGGRESSVRPSDHFNTI